MPCRLYGKSLADFPCLNARHDRAALVLIATIALMMPMESVARLGEPDSFNAELGISAMRFKYDEFNDDGRVLDTELGGIPGVSFKLGQHFSDWEWEGIGSYHRGRVRYTGQTSSGAPYSTRTDERITDIGLRLGRWFDGGYPWMPYAGLGYRRWDRDILPNTLNGLFESYGWFYGWVGAKIVAMQGEQSQLTLDIGLLKPWSPVMHVDFRGTYNVAPVVYPESKIGWRMMLTSELKLTGNTQLMLEPYVEYWELGRSPTVAMGNISVHEPASKTNNIGINLRFGRVF